MKYLILGSSGQIGCALTKYLSDCGNIVVEHDIKRDPQEDLRLIDVNLEATQMFIRKLAWSDFVCFLAYDVGGSKYLEKYEKTYEFITNNIIIMNKVFKYLKISKKPFIFASSQMADMPHTPYGNTKLIGEQYTKSINGMVVRMWNVFGKEEVGEKAHVITDFVEQARKNGKIQLLTNGEEYRQFLYSADCCEAFYFLSKNYNKLKYKNLHLTSFKWHNIKELAQIVAEQMNCKWNVGNKIDRVQNLIKIEPDPFILKYWQPKTSLEEGVKCIIEKMKD